MTDLAPTELHRRLDNRERLRVVDVREPDEHARGHLPGAVCIPRTDVAEFASQWRNGTGTVLVCWSGARARLAAEALEALGVRGVQVLEGGMQAWEKAGLPIRFSKKGVPLQRQVLIGAGLVNLLGLFLGLVNPWVIAVTGFASGMLVVAGVTGFCPMAMALARAPWNRPIAAAAPNAAERSSTCCDARR